jgi:UDP-glucose 4-epimerase
MKKVLVTGGAGFVGSHLCEELVKRNYQVTSLDNYYMGSSANHVEGVRYINGTTVDIKKLVDFEPDYIYHLGEYSRVEQSFDDIEVVYEFNKQGTFSVLEFARKVGCKIIYAGSSTMFGDGGLGRSQSPYAWTKASNTELVENYGTWFNIPYAIVYFYNVYGKREISQGKYATLIALFCRKMANNETLTVVKPGTQQRNFTHISDIISGIILVGENGYGDEFGIGSPESYSILEVAKLFSDKVEFLPERPGNRMAADVMVEKTKQLGWEPKVRLSDYVNEVRGKGWDING